MADPIIGKISVGDGATYTPSVSNDGVISWTNNKGLINPAPVDLSAAVIDAQNFGGFFDNVADMVGADLDVSVVVGTKGYYTPNDAGNGFYIIRAKDVSDVDDGGSIIFLNNGNVAELIINETANVHQFGARGNANYQDLNSGIFYENISLVDAIAALYYDNVDNTGSEKWYVNATFADEGIYENGGKHHYSTTAVEAVYEDNVGGGWYVSAVFSTEGTYVNPDDGQHYVNYDPDTQEYSDLAPYYDNVADKWYVSAVYSDQGEYTYNDAYWYITDAVEAPYLDNVNNKWYVSAVYSDLANAKMGNNYYYGATFSVPASDDTAAIQRAINTHVPISLLNGHGYIVTKFTIYHGFKLVGNGGRLQRPNLLLPPYNYTATQIKWLRMFDCSPNLIGQNTEDKTIEIHDVYIDDNSWSMWDISHPYKYEQGVNFYLAGNSAHHIKILLDDVHFSNHYASNVTVANYCDVTITDSSTWDCFKGICTVVGASGTVKINNVVCDSRRNWVTFWYEPNSGSTRKDERIVISNCIFNGVIQGLDNPYSSTIIADTIFYITRNDDDMTIAPHPGSVMIFSNCSFFCPDYSSFDIKLRGDGNTIINSCDIKGAGFFCKHSTANDHFGNIRISNCKFHESVFGVVCDKTGEFNVVVDGCEFKNISSRVFGAHPDNSLSSWRTFLVSNCIFDIESRLVVVSGNASSKVPVFNGGNDVINPNNTGIRIYGSNKIFMKDEFWSVPVPISKYRTGNTWVAVGFGSRMTYVTEAPTFVGINGVDHAQLTVSPYTKYSYVNNAWQADA